MNCFKHILVFSLIFLTCTKLLAQQGNIKGAVTDTFNKTTLQYTSILLLKKDSTLYKFTRTDKDGNFVLQNIAEGKYKLIVTQKGYADYTDDVTIMNDVINVGTIKLLLKANLLADVTVVQKIAAMRMKGDTLEYKTDSFKVKAGATVEDLLKVLPGIQVDKDGNITAQGEKIEKILVDGEEFFGNDPTMATKGLQADALDKIQVFDKKSDQAAFTGIDDGAGSKTLNLKLKDDKKKGFFGKLDLAGGTNKMFSNTAMINAFKKKRKLSGFAVMSNTGKIGLDWQDNEKYGGSSNMEYDESMGYFYNEGSGDDFDDDRYYGQGLPTSWGAALHYSDKFKNDKQNLNASYRFNKLNINTQSSSFNQYLIPGNYYYTRDTVNSYSTKFRHALSGFYDIQIDSSTSIKISLNASKGESQSTTRNGSTTFEEDGNFRNSNNRVTTNDGDNDKFQATILLRKKFKKAGRTISLNLDGQTTNKTSNGFLYSLTSTLKTGAIQDTLTDQKKENTNETKAFTGKVVYTEPITTKLFAEVNYALRINNNVSERLSYNDDGTGKYANLDEDFSNNYKYNYNINSSGLSLKYNGKKIVASAGTDIAFTNFKQQDLFKDSIARQDATNFFPKAQFNYKFTSNTRINITYNGSTRQPTITQIQPIRDNNDPLNIPVGNADLKQQFNHRVRFNFNSWKVLSQSGIYVNGSFSPTSNAISRYETIDTNRIRSYQYINVKGNHNYYSYMGYNRKVKSIDAYVGISVGVNGSRNINFINKEKNTSVSFNPSFNLNFNKYKENKYSINFYGGANYNTTKSTINKDAPTKYWSYNFNPSLYVNLPWKMEINIDGDLQIREKTNEFDTNNDVYLVNAFIGKKILKNDKASIRLQAYDIFNQNKGFDRYNDANTFRQNNYNTITRYFSLNFIWNFSKMPAGMAPQQ